MTQHGPFRHDKGVQGSELIQYQILDILTGDLHLAPTESNQIRKSGMGSDGNSLFEGQSDGFPHGGWVAGVKSAGNVGRGHVCQNFGVLAKLIGSEAFSEIAVQVDGLDDARILSSVSVERNSTAQPINLDFAGTKFLPCCFEGDGLESNF